MKKTKNSLLGLTAILLILFSGSAGAFHHHDISKACSHDSHGNKDCALCHHITHAGMTAPNTDVYVAPCFNEYTKSREVLLSYETTIITSYVSRAPPAFIV